MEVFAVAANVMAAVSLTLQLVDTIENIKEFWKGMRNAPEETKQIIGDLELLGGILDGVRRAYVKCWPLELVLTHKILTYEFQNSDALSRRARPGSGFLGSFCSSTMSETYL
jgi:hypothetical protein